MPKSGQRIALAFLLFLLISLWGCTPSDKNGESEVGRRPRPKIVIDPGHGGEDTGATAGGTPYEKDIVLDIALHVRRALRRRHYNVITTRKGDEFISLWKRAGIANNDHADLFVSIHANSCDRGDVSGIEIYYADDGHRLESLTAARFIQQSLVRTTLAKDRGIRSGSYAVLVRTRCPSVLVEVGYLSNAKESDLLSTGLYRKKIADGIVNGVVAYLRSRS
jgi:N-acetylmuramoyl-L-alanine amidase